MKEIIVIRHGEKTGDDLTHRGVDESKALSQRIGDFAIVLCSEPYRAIRTAELVSQKQVLVDPRANIPSYSEDEFNRLTVLRETHPRGAFGAIWESPILRDDVRDAGQNLLGLVRETMQTLPDSGRALIVSHDGTIIGLEKLLRNDSFETLDRTFEPLQGIAIDENFNVRTFN